MFYLILLWHFHLFISCKHFFLNFTQHFTHSLIALHSEHIKILNFSMTHKQIQTLKQFFLVQTFRPFVRSRFQYKIVSFFVYIKQTQATHAHTEPFVDRETSPPTKTLTSRYWFSLSFFLSLFMSANINQTLGNAQFVANKWTMFVIWSHTKACLSFLPLFSIFFFLRSLLLPSRRVIKLTLKRTRARVQ